MEAVVWSFRTWSGFALSAPLVLSLFILLLLCWDYLLLLPRALAARVVRGGARIRSLSSETAPSALVVIPTLLRRRDELTSLLSTIGSVATNGYPGELFIVVSIDGTDDAPELYRELEAWAAGRAPDGAGSRRWLYVTGTPGRRGKPMAIEQAVAFLEQHVARGTHAAFPTVYISTDADADLGPGALERLVARLMRRHPITGWPARAVAGNLYIRGNDFWQGWRRFFTIEGQLTMQVAREYLVTNVARHNLRWMPLSGVPGVLYCTWTDIFLDAPRFMGYMRTLRPIDWLKWWVGCRPPSFSANRAAPIPELLAGDTDDTVSAYLAIIARFAGGRFTLEPPRTPLHAFLYMLRAVFLDRALRYEPEARVYTSSPTTIKSLFRQRKRWNCSRIEVTGRFWRAMWFHWSLGLPAMGILFLIGKYCLFGGLMYLRLPMAVGRPTVITAFLLGYGCQLAGYSLLTFFALLMNGELRHWRLMLALPLSPLYSICFSYAPSLTGAVCDVLLFGNVTGFAPETTLIRGGSARIALSFRLRRALLLATRALFWGDVPLGRFWLGWGETPWTPSGFQGWTTRRRPRSILPFGRRPPTRPTRPTRPTPPTPPSWPGALLVLLVVVAGGARVTHASDQRDAGGEVFVPVAAADLSVTSGRVERQPSGALALRDATIRAVVGDRSRSAIEIAFDYLGPTHDTAPLASGERRRQIGLKLRAHNDCNVVYVMWYLEPSVGIHVSVKSNPGQERHATCGDRGYVTVPASWVRGDLKPVAAGSWRSLAAAIEDDDLRVFADGTLAWQGKLPAFAFAFDGPVGFRSDNGEFDVMLRASPPLPAVQK